MVVSLFTQRRIIDLLRSPPPAPSPGPTPMAVSALTECSYHIIPVEDCAPLWRPWRIGPGRSMFSELRHDVLVTLAHLGDALRSALCHHGDVKGLRVFR
jgi:hypothetical protein